MQLELEGYPLQRRGDILFGVKKDETFELGIVLLEATYSCHKIVRPDLIYPEGQGACQTLLCPLLIQALTEYM
jgi:hypothetical protein